MIPSLPKLRKALLSLLAFAAFLPAAPRAHAIEIVLDFTFDEQNYNLFNPATADGLARRRAVESAAGFLSTIIRNDDWNPISNLNRRTPGGVAASSRWREPAVTVVSEDEPREG